MQKIARYNGTLMSLVLLEEKLASLKGLQVWECACGIRCMTIYYAAFHCEKHHKGEKFKDKIKLKEELPTDTTVWSGFYSSLSDILVQSIESKTRSTNESLQFEESRVKNEPVDEELPQRKEESAGSSNVTVAAKEPLANEDETKHINVNIPVENSTLAQPVNDEPDSDKTSEEGIYVVQEIVDIKAFVKDKALKYKIRWQGFGMADDTWEPSETLSDPLVAAMIETYRQSNKEKVEREEAKLNGEKKIAARGRLRKTWDIVELDVVPNRSDLTKPRELDKSDEFYGIVAGKIKGEAKQLFDPTHKNTPTELLLSILPTNERVTRRQMREFLPEAASTSGCQSYADLSTPSSPTERSKTRRERTKNGPAVSPSQNSKISPTSVNNPYDVAERVTLKRVDCDSLSSTVESVVAKRSNVHCTDVGANCEVTSSVSHTEIRTSIDEPIANDTPTETNSSGGSTPNVFLQAAPVLPGMIMRPEIPFLIPDPAMFPYPYFGYVYDYNSLFNPDNTPTAFHWHKRAEYYSQITQHNLDPLTARGLWMQQNAKNHIL